VRDDFSIAPRDDNNVEEDSNLARRRSRSAVPGRPRVTCGAHLDPRRVWWLTHVIDRTWHSGRAICRVAWISTRVGCRIVVGLATEWPNMADAAIGFPIISRVDRERCGLLSCPRRFFSLCGKKYRRRRRCDSKGPHRRLRHAGHRSDRKAYIRPARIARQSRISPCVAADGYNAERPVDAGDAGNDRDAVRCHRPPVDTFIAIELRNFCCSHGRFTRRRRDGAQLLSLRRALKT